MNTQSALTDRKVSPWLALWCGALIMALALGIRHTFGLFLQPMSLDHGWGRESFALAIAVQNLAWGIAQPFTGRLADRFGARLTMALGGLFYGLGLIGMAYANHEITLTVCAGLLIGLGLSGTTYPVVFGAIARALPQHQHSMAMGLSMALGALGQFVFLPTGLTLINRLGWQTALLIMGGLSLLMIALAQAVGQKKPLKKESAIEVIHETEVSMIQTLRTALKHRDFILLGLGYFVCGFQVVFIAVHLPSYLLDKGLSASVGSFALALIGLFNVIGSYTAGHLGGKHPKPRILTGIYAVRAVLISLFLLLPLTPLTVYVFAAGMGVVWLSTVPLTTGTVSTMFGVKDLAMLSGLVFLFHQTGAFLGGWLGGVIFDKTASYLPIWLTCIALSLLSALINASIQEEPAPLPLMRDPT